MSGKINLDNISIVLQKPRYPENIGAAARAMRNMGIGNLVVVKPENFDLEKMLKLATHAASDVVDRIEVYNNLFSALANYNYIVGTTARLGGERRVISTPSELAEKLVSLSFDNRIAIIFGPEDRGLTNDEIRSCHTLVNIPTGGFSSLNLGHAVMIICYEFFTAANDGEKKFIPKLACMHELEGMYDQLKDVLIKISYINPENPDYWMTKLRQFLNGFQFRSREVSIVRGICRQINWYGKKCFKDGRNNIS